MAKLVPGATVVLTNAPATLLQGLTKEDQDAIQAFVGQPVTFAGYRFGQAELKFTDQQGDDHSIWVEQALIRPA